MRNLASLVALLPIIALAEEPAAAPSKWTVVPFAALSGDVPQRSGAKAAAMLVAELKNLDGVTVVDAKKPALADPHAEGLDRARKAVEHAKELRGKRKFRLADEALNKAIADYKASAPGVADVGELVDAWALLSAVQYNTGRDDEGSKSLQLALALAPARELPLAKTSTLFSRVVEDTRKQVQASGKGSLLIESMPSGAGVFVDGVPLGSTPLSVKDVPPGQHLWKVQMPSGEALGGVAEVASGKTAKVEARSTAKDPESKLLASLSQNKVDADALAAAKEQAAGTGADYVWFGALARDGKNLSLESFVLAAAGGEVRRLPRSSFDSELLSAPMAFFSLAGQVAQQGAKMGEAMKVPGAVTQGSLTGTKLAEARYGVPFGKETLEVEAAVEPTGKDEGPRHPVDPNKKRAPLQKKK